MEEELPAGLGEGQIAELVEDHKVEATEQIGRAALAVIARLGIKLVHEVNHVEEAAPLPLRMQARAMPTARCDLPVPVPPISKTLR